MKTLRRLYPLVLRLSITVGFALLCSTAFGQPQSIAGNGASTGSGKPVTVPVTIRVKEETELQNIDLSIHEDGEPQTIISLRGIGTSTPISLAVLIQEDLVPSVGNEIKALADFIRNMPKGSRVRRWLSIACIPPHGGPWRSRLSARGEWTRRARPCATYASSSLP